MSIAFELDLAIEQIDDLLSKVHANGPQLTAPPANETNTNSKDPLQHWTVSE